MTEDILEIQAYVERLELYLWLIIGLFALSLIATLVLLFYPFKEGDEE